MRDNPRLGITLMLLATLVFAVQDGLSVTLAREYGVLPVVTVRFWFFGLFVLCWSHWKGGGIAQVAKSKRPMLQITRGVLLVLEICVMVSALTVLGMIESHAVFSCYPLVVVALSGVVLGEKVGWRRWAAVLAGFIGVLIILRPGAGVVSAAALVALASSVMFAVYNLMTRLVSRVDSATTSLFWTGVMGMLTSSALVPFFWQPIRSEHWGLMGALCLTGILGHFTLIKALEAADTATTQPFAYFHLVFASIIGMAVYGEVLDPMVAVGASVVVLSGLFTIWRAKQRAMEDADA